MPLQTTGPISLKQIADEFEDTAPHSMSEFYGLTNTLPGNGRIDFDDFYGQSKGFRLTITSNTVQYNLNTDLIANGWNSIDPIVATITINSGIYVYSNNTSIAGFTIGTLPAGSTVSIINNGYIMGKGGNGGAGTQSPHVYAANPGGAGGPAINLNYPVSITNNSYIGGGGGGGGSSSADYAGSVACGGGGGAGAGTGGGGNPGGAGGAGGNPGASGANGGSYAGGGGGRIMPGNATTAYSQGGQAGGSGARRFSNGNGSYGLGGGAGNPGGSAVNDGSRPFNSGGGGGWGASGGAGVGVGGGAGGKAVNLNGNSVIWLVTGTRYGAIS